MFDSYALTFSHWDSKNKNRLRVFKIVKITTTEQSARVNTIWSLSPPQFEEGTLYSILSGGDKYLIVNDKGTIREAAIFEIISLMNTGKSNAAV